MRIFQIFFFIGVALIIIVFVDFDFLGARALIKTFQSSRKKSHFVCDLYLIVNHKH